MMLQKLLTAAPALCLSTALLCPSQSVAQSESKAPDVWPARPIRYVIPFPPGGPGDILGRSFAQKMAEGFGKPVIVENKPGGNTVIGADFVAKAAPNGYTILMAIASTLTINPHLPTPLPYDPDRAFAPVGLIANVQTVLVGNKDFPPNNVRELIAYAKERPGQLFASAGEAQIYLGAVLFNRMAGVDIVPVNYKGGTTGIQAILGGEVPLGWLGASNAIANWKAGKIKIYGIMSRRHIPGEPELRTLDEAGVPGYDVPIWQSIVVPAGTPPAVITRLNRELVRIAALPELRERLAPLGIEPISSTPEEMSRIVLEASSRWGKVIKEIKFQIE